MAQKEIWEKEYKQAKLVSLDDKPQAFLSRYLRKYRFKSGLEFSEWTVLDLGCGTGRNANYLASKGANVTGIEISSEALRLAKERAKEKGVQVRYLEQSIGEPYPVEDESVDVILDITSSNSLNEAERDIYLKECDRVLKSAGVLFVRGLCLEGDKNAKNLLKLFPGPEPMTYVMPKTGIVERVFTEHDLRKRYGQFFYVKSFDKAVTYTPFEGQPYKRYFFFAWLTKKEL